MNPRDLIATARGLTEIDPRRPSQANLLRAVSTAYYAMFHCLAGTAANLLIGKGRSEAWHRAYRALEHGSAKNACRNKEEMQRFSPEIQGFADTFADLQEARQGADYALDGDIYLKSRVLGDVASAEYAITQFEQADVQHRRAFAAHVLFRRRPSKGGST